VLALQLFGEGQCWYDDLEVILDPEPEKELPAVITPIEDGAGGAMVEVDGETCIMVCGSPGKWAPHLVGDHIVETDAEIAVIRMGVGAPRAFVLRGTKVALDGVQIAVESGEWREGPIE